MSEERVRCLNERRESRMIGRSIIYYMRSPMLLPCNSQLDAARDWLLVCPVQYSHAAASPRPACRHTPLPKSTSPLQQKSPISYRQPPSKNHS